MSKELTQRITFVIPWCSWCLGGEHFRVQTPGYSFPTSFANSSSTLMYGSIDGM